MADHPLRVAATAEAGVVEDTLLDAFMKRMPLAIGPTETLSDITQVIGSAPLAVVSATTGYLYFYDETDAVTADDGITCLVDGNGRRYKQADSASINVNSVLAVEGTPPVSPSLGDAYVVDVAPTGVWAAQANNIAIQTTRGWVYATGQTGLTVYNEATSTNLQFNGSAWVGFASATSISAGTGIAVAGSTVSMDHLGIEDLADPNADRIPFWDDSAGKVDWLIPGSGLAITGTTINVTVTASTEYKQQPTTDVTSLTQTGLSGHKKIRGAFHLGIHSGNTDVGARIITLEARVSGGTWRSIGTLVTTPSVSGDDTATVAGWFEIDGFNEVNEKVVTGYGASSAFGGSSVLDSSDAANNLSISAGAAFFAMPSWNETWDEVRLVLSGGSSGLGFEGSTSDQRGYLFITGF